MANADALLTKLCDFSNLSSVLKEIMAQFSAKHDEQQREIRKLQHVQDDLCKFADNTPNQIRTVQETLANLDHRSHEQGRQLAMLEKWMKNSEDKMYEQRLSALEAQMRGQKEMMDAVRSSYEAKADKVEVMRELSLKASATEITAARTDVLRSGATLRRDVEQAIEAINATLSSGLAVAKRTADKNCERLSQVETQMKTVNINSNIERFIEARIRESEERIGLGESFSEQVSNRVSMWEQRIVDNNKTIKRLAEALETAKMDLSKRQHMAEERLDREDDRAREYQQRLNYVEQNKAEHTAVARELDDITARFEKAGGLGAGPVGLGREHVFEQLEGVRQRLGLAESRLTTLNGDVTLLMRRERDRDGGGRSAAWRERRIDDVKREEILDGPDVVPKIKLEEMDIEPTQKLMLGHSTKKLLNRHQKGAPRVGGGYEFSSSRLSRSPPPPPLGLHDSQAVDASNPHLRVGSPTESSSRGRSRSYREVPRSASLSHKTTRSRSRRREQVYWGSGNA